MSRLYQISLLFVFLVSTAMHCDNRTLKIAQELDLQVNPNPIPIENGRASFQLITKPPPVKTLKKIDSLVFDLGYRFNYEHIIVGSTKVIPPTNWDVISCLYDSAFFELSELLVPNNTALHIQMTMYRNGSSKQTQELVINKFIK